MPFVEGDILDFSFLEPQGPFTLESPATTPTPSLKTLTSLNPLRGHVSAIYTASFFHLFSEQDQLCIAKKLASLLSPESGSMILGAHLGHHVKGLLIRGTDDHTKFCHSPESWKVMWDDIFGKGKVEVKARLRVSAVKVSEFFADTQHSRGSMMEWSVTRL